MLTKITRLLCTFVLDNFLRVIPFFFQICFVIVRIDDVIRWKNLILKLKQPLAFTTIPWGQKISYFPWLLASMRVFALRTCVFLCVSWKKYAAKLLCVFLKNKSMHAYGYLHICTSMHKYASCVFMSCDKSLLVHNVCNQILQVFHTVTSVRLISKML